MRLLLPPWKRLILLICLVLSLPLPGRSFPAGRQTYYLLGYDEHIVNFLRKVDEAEFAGNKFNDDPPTTVSSIIAITVPLGGQIIVYDHGEDGLESSYANIPTTHIRDIAGGGPGTTEIWGDGDTNNGIPPNDPNGDDILDDQQIVELESSPVTNFTGYAQPCANNRCSPVPTNPRNPSTSSLRYDGIDVIYTVGQPINVAQVLYPANATGNLTTIGGSWEVFPLEAYAENFTYTIPVGRDSYTNNSSAAGAFENFKNVWAVVHATEDQTAVVVDNGSAAPVDFVLNRGESWASTSIDATGCGGPAGDECGAIDSNTSATAGVIINQNTRITASKPVQVGMVTAGDGAFQTRFYNVLPTGLYASEYLSPVYSGQAADLTADMFINNPNDFSITVRARSLTQNKVITVPPSSAVSFANSAPQGYISNGSSLRLTSTELFWGIGSYSSGGDATSPGTGANGTAGDWGWALQASGFIQDEVVCAHGPGNVDHVNGSGAPAGTNGSPIWVGCAEDNTTVEADWDRDGNADPTDIDNDGSSDGLSFSCDALETLTLYDPSDNIQGGGVIRANAPFSASYGYNDSPGSNDPGTTTNVDWGYSVNPKDPRLIEPVIDIQKTVIPTSVAAGGIVTYTLLISTGKLGPVTNNDIEDTLPAGFSYVSGSTTVTYPNLSTASFDPAISGQVLTWNISQTLQTNQELKLTFRAQHDGTTNLPCTPTASTATDNFSSGNYTGGTGWVGNWTEHGDNNNSASGNIQVNNPGLGCNNSNWIRWFNNTGVMGVTRQVNLSAFCQPQLQVMMLSNGTFQSLAVQGSTDGTTFSTLQNLTSSSTINCENFTVDLSAFAGSPTFFLRFERPSTNVQFLIDNLVISDAAGAGISSSFTNSAITSATFEGFTIKADDEVDHYISDLVLTKAVDLDQAEVGDLLTYTLTFENTSGSTTYSNISIQDSIPPFTVFRQGSITNAAPFTGGAAGTYDDASKSVTWGTASLAPGASGSITYQVEVTRVPFDLTEVTNIAFLLENGTRTIDSNEVRTEIRTPIFELVKTAPGSIAGGETLDFDLTFRNSGAVGATGVDVSDRVPFVDVSGTPTRLSYVLGTATPAATFSNDNGATFTYTPTDGADAVTDGADQTVTHIKFGVSSIASGAETTAAFSALVPVGADGAEVIRNFAFLVNDQTPIKVTTFSETVVSDLGLELRGPSVACPRQTLEFCLDPDVKTGTFTNVEVDQAIPTYSVYDSGSASAPAGWTILYSTDNGANFSSTEPALGSDVTDLRFTIASLPTPTVVASEDWQTPASPANPASYQNGSGWAGNWTETGESTSATGGQIQVRNRTGATICDGNALELRNATGRGVFREVDLSALHTETAKVSLDFSYSLEGVSGSEGFAVRVATDSGFSSQVTTLRSFDANALGSCKTASLDLSDYAGEASVFVGFFGLTNDSTNDRLRVDDIQVTSGPRLCFDVVADEFIPGNTSLTAEANIESTETNAFDPIASNDLTIPVVNLRVTKVADKTVAKPNETITWTVQVQNIGSAVATNVVLEEPGRTSFNIFSQTDPVLPIPNSGTFASDTVTWALGTLIPFNPATIRTFQSTVDAAATTGSSITNLAEVLSDQCSAFSNTVTVVVAGVGVTVGPDSSAQGDQGDVIDYTLSVTNTGNTTDSYNLALSVSDSDWVTSSFHQVFLDVDGDGTYDPGLDTAFDPDTDTLTDLAPNQTVKLIVRVTIPPDGAGAGDNTAPDGDTNVTTVTATSTSNGTVTDSAALTTEVLSATSITLVNLAATGTPRGVSVTWRTVGEHRNLGFYLERGPTLRGPWTPAHCCMIPGQGSFLGVKDYQVLDPEAPAQGPLFYRLSDRDDRGALQRHPPVAVDRDGDGLPFLDEEAYGLSDQDPLDAGLDPDQDGTSTLEEVHEGRDPFTPDSPDPTPKRGVIQTLDQVPEGLTILTNTAHELIAELNLGPVILDEVRHKGALYQRVQTPWTGGYTEQPGRPKLPRLGHLSEVRLEKLEVLALESRSQIVLPPEPVPQAREDVERSNLLPEYQPDPAFYQTGTQAYPEAPARLESVGAASRLWLQPFSFDPQSKVLTIHTRIRIRAQKAPPTIQGLTPSSDGGLAALPSGDLYRIHAKEAGLYRLTGTDLTNLGVSSSGKDPRNLRLFRGSQEIPIQVQGESDASLDPGDALEFLQPEEGDRYSFGESLFLVWGSDPGARLSQDAIPNTSDATLDWYRFTHQEAFRDFYFATLPGDPSEDRFVETLFDTATSTFRHPTAGSQVFPARVEFPVELIDPAPASLGVPASIRYAASSDRPGSPDHHAILSWDGVPIGEELWDGSGFREARGLITQTLTPGTHQLGLEASLRGLPRNVSTDQFVPSSLKLTYPRLPRARGDLVRYHARIADAKITFTGFTQAEVQLWDLTQPWAPKKISNLAVAPDGAGGFQATFPHDPSQERHLLLFSPSAARGSSDLIVSPLSRPTVSLRDPTRRAKWVAIVPDESYRSALDPLVQLRTQDQLEPLVLTMQQVSDEFTGGLKHPEAIRRLVQYATQHWAQGPEFLVLASDTHVNPKQYPGVFSTSVEAGVPTHFSFVGGKEYQSESGDDGYFVRSGLGAVPDLAVGRLPAKNPTQLLAMAQKLVAYDQATGAWNREILSVADDGETLFTELADQNLAVVLPGLSIQKYHQADDQAFPNLATYKAQLQAALEAGSLLVQFIGHANFNTWTADDVLDGTAATGLTNADKLPFIVSMTCYDNQFTVVPEQNLEALGEILVRNPNGGAVAFYGSGVQSTILAKNQLHQALLQSIFSKDHRRLGTAIQEGLRAYLASSSDPERLAAAFNLLGDPATLLKLPNPRQPQGLLATQDQDTITLTWSPVADPNLEGYEVYLRVDSGPRTRLTTTQETRFTQTLPDNSQAGSLRVYTIRAVTPDGLASSFSGEGQLTQQAFTSTPTPTPAPTSTPSPAPAPGPRQSGGGGCQGGANQSFASLLALAWMAVLGLKGRARTQDQKNAPGEASGGESRQGVC